MTIRWKVRPARELHMVHDQWQALNRAGSGSPALEPAFVLPLLEHFGDGSELLATASAGDGPARDDHTAPHRAGLLADVPAFANARRTLAATARAADRGALPGAFPGASGLPAAGRHHAARSRYPGTPCLDGLACNARLHSNRPHYRGRTVRCLLGGAGQEPQAQHEAPAGTAGKGWDEAAPRLS